MAMTTVPGRVRMATATWRALPDFVILGAQKGGTSSLYQYLAQHPHVLPALKKEVHYFGWEYGRGEHWYRAHFPLRAVRDMRQHLTRGTVLTGEATPYYLFHPHVPGRMHATVPHAKFIVLLRDPVDRAVSSYQHQVRQGREVLSLADAVAREDERLAGEVERLVREPLYNSEAHRHFSYLARGLYADQLAGWFGLFPREQFLILRSEDFFKATPSVFAQVLSFLGLTTWQPSEFQRFNVRRKSRDAGVPAETRQFLVDYFAPHNRRLEELVGRDFGWSAS